MIMEESKTEMNNNEIVGASIGCIADEAPTNVSIDTYVKKVNTENFLELYMTIINLNYSEDDVRKFMKAFNKILQSIDVSKLKDGEEHIIPKIVRDGVMLLGSFTLNEAIKESSITTGVLETIKKVKDGEYLNAFKCITNITTDIFKFIEGDKNVTKKEK